MNLGGREKVDKAVRRGNNTWGGVSEGNLESGQKKATKAQTQGRGRVRLVTEKR